MCIRDSHTLHIVEALLVLAYCGHLKIDELHQSFDVLRSRITLQTMIERTQDVYKRQVRRR